MTVISVVKKKKSSRNSFQVGKIYQAKFDMCFYNLYGLTGVEWLKTINSKKLFMVLENRCQKRFTKIITGDGEVGYIDSSFHYEGGGTVEKIV